MELESEIPPIEVQRMGLKIAHFTRLRQLPIELSVSGLVEGYLKSKKLSLVDPALDFAN